MKVFVGSISYFATGEGVHNWIYIARAADVKIFERNMMEDLNIDPYYMAGIEFDNPEILKKYENEIHAINMAGYGCFKSYLGLNFS